MRVRDLFNEMSRGIVAGTLDEDALVLIRYDHNYLCEASTSYLSEDSDGNPLFVVGD